MGREREMGEEETCLGYCSGKGINSPILQRIKLRPCRYALALTAPVGRFSPTGQCTMLKSGIDPRDLATGCSHSMTVLEVCRQVPCVPKVSPVHKVM